MEELCTLDRLEEQQGLSSEEKERKCVVIRDWRTLSCRKRLVGDRSLGFFGWKRVINALNFFTELLTRTGGLIP
jgi:hypothetical protein